MYTSPMHDALPILVAISRPDYVWEPGWIEAVCIRHGRLRIDYPGHNFDECECGFWSTRKPTATVYYTGPRDTRKGHGNEVVNGVVLLAGRVVVCEQGFRSTHAKILALSEEVESWLDPEGTRHLLDRYDVPMLPSDDLLKYAEWFGRQVEDEVSWNMG